MIRAGYDMLDADCIKKYSASHFKYLASCIFLFYIITLPAISSSKNTIEVQNIRQWSSKGYTRVVVDLSGPIEFTKKRLSIPDRLYFDLKNSRILKEIDTTLPVGDGILKTVRAGQFNKNTVRLVLDLEEIKDFRAFILDEPTRLVIDVYGYERVAIAQERVPLVKKIVLDPGHGGHDPGAIGPRNLHEKDVVLDIALRLKGILSKNEDFKVFLTRDKDVFIPLEERTAFANSVDADIFISIHANASPQKITRGVETYLLNWTDEEEAIRVAARENAISIRKMRDMHKQMDIVEMIKADLAREIKRDKSIKLANYIQDSIVSTLGEKHSTINNLGVKGALFFVLFGAEMSSALVEVSFISNPVEEKLLAKEAYRENIAKAIADGINAYLTATSSEQKMARQSRHNSLLR